MKSRYFEIIQILFLIAMVLIIFGIALTLGGCRSTPCIPKVEIQEKLVPQPCVIGITTLPDIELPSYPPFDPNDPKEWALEVERIAKEREAVLKTRVEALDFQIAEHNKLEPACSH